MDGRIGVIQSRSTLGNTFVFNDNYLKAQEGWSEKPNPGGSRFWLSGISYLRFGTQLLGKFKEIKLIVDKVANSRKLDKVTAGINGQLCPVTVFKRGNYDVICVRLEGQRTFDKEPVLLKLNLGFGAPADGLPAAADHGALDGVQVRQCEGVLAS